MQLGVGLRLGLGFVKGRARAGAGARERFYGFLERLGYDGKYYPLRTTHHLLCTTYYSLRATTRYVLRATYVLERLGHYGEGRGLQLEPSLALGRLVRRRGGARDKVVGWGYGWGWGWGEGEDWGQGQGQGWGQG